MDEIYRVSHMTLSRRCSRKFRRSKSIFGRLLLGKKEGDRTFDTPYITFIKENFQHRRLKIHIIDEYDKFNIIDEKSAQL